MRLENLTQLVRQLPLTDEEEPEDIFAYAPGLIFTDDLRTSHGDSKAKIVYHSAQHGDIELRTADPQSETDRRLFGHYLWNAGVLLAERLSGRRMINGHEAAQFSVKDQSVVELGAGVGLAGIIASLSGAREVVITDYPSKSILDNITLNVEHNAKLFGQVRPTVQGHEWGVYNDGFSTSKQNYFDRVLAADCYWMPQVHEELAQSMLHFLSLDDSARVLAIGGFHTGRANLASFFTTASAMGLETEEIYEEDAEGVRREWSPERDGGREHTTERNKWLVIAVLRRRRPN